MFARRCAFTVSKAGQFKNVSNSLSLPLNNSAAATSKNSNNIGVDTFYVPKIAARWHGGVTFYNNPQIKLTFIDPKLPEEEKTKSVIAYVGETLLQVAHRHEIDLEGACEGVCACSTCHVILNQGLYSALPDPSEDEEDMLDMAFGLTDTSRLGCQVEVTESMDGEVIRLPAATRNFYVDGHLPKPH
mmetsp:Transcript_24802/g.35571  ORF Transcript_24802/g.35571 Transcript_24802/m.35571 type:complete len:187 (-) Transcript_24802:170-730(-)|eukprot:CAMPEP_0172427364 /NCGR_PEP_ID=MMETSP1064-20121228/41812_1 /TAXON_ID=202472 /ORGANISM="Aulacoseira subarctica , Strain CCAP 1002/5" /LENGTH=186 /DNA_ID=CAMNT_0013171537 /DNA_START=56 /DNA_END=616 /DNA_ORIENTATION=-